jgi:hypothetical protein
VGRLTSNRRKRKGAWPSLAAEDRPCDVGKGSLESNHGVVLLVLAAALFAAQVAVGCDSDADSRPLTVVSGRTIIKPPTGGQVTPDAAYLALYESSLPLEAFVDEQAFGQYTGEIAEGLSDDEGRFTFSADIDEESAAHLILYAKCEQIGCSAPGGCVYKALPALRRGDERWVVRSSGHPLSVTLRIGIDHPDSPCF